MTLSQIGMNIGVPTLNTFQPNTTYMVSDVFSKVSGQTHLEVWRRIPLPACQRTELRQPQRAIHL